MGRLSSFSWVLLAFVALMLVGAEIATGQAPAGKDRSPFYRSFVLIEVDELHRDQAGEGGESAGTRVSFPYVFDSRRGILRPTPEAQERYLLQGSRVIVLHRIKYEGQRRHGSYWTVHGFHDLPVTMDLPAVPEQGNLALSADEKNRFVRPVSLSWLKEEPGRGPRLHVEYGSESADLAEGQGWTSRPSWFPAVFGDLKRPVHIGSEVSVRFCGLVRCCPYVKEEEEAQLLLLEFGKGGPQKEAAHELLSIGDAAIPAVVPVLAGTSDDKTLALSCLEALCAREAVPQIVPLLDWPEWYIAKQAAYALGQIGDERAVEPLLKVLKENKSDAVIFAAAGALGRISDRRALPVLESLLADANLERKLSAAAALGLMGRADGLQVAISALKGNERGVFTDAMQTIWAIGGTEGEKALTEFGRQHEKDQFGEEAALFAGLVASRLNSVAERQTYLSHLLRGDSRGRLWGTFEVQMLPLQEGLAVYEAEMRQAEMEGDWQAAADLRTMAWRFLAAKAGAPIED